MPPNIVPIVEGQGEVESVPIIARRIAQALGVNTLQVRRPIRIPRDKLLKQGELERAIEFAVRKGEGQCQVLILIDAHTDAPCKLAPALTERATKARGDVPIGVVLAKSEVESWFLGAIESLRGQYGISDHAASPADPESIQGAKERLASLMGVPYSSRLDQPGLAAQFDMDQARRACQSFDKLWRVLESMIAAGQAP